MKNRFCRNTKLSEDAFKYILFLCLRDVKATDAPKMLQDRWKVKVSRQTISTMYLKLGEYIYQRLFRQMFIDGHKKMNPKRNESDEYWENLHLDRMFRHMRGTLDYADLRKQGSMYPMDGVNVLEPLRRRWRSLNGFPHSKFKSHFGIVCYQSLPMPQTDEGILQRVNHLLRVLDKDPL